MAQFTGNTGNRACPGPMHGVGSHCNVNVKPGSRPTSPQFSPRLADPPTMAEWWKIRYTPPTSDRMTTSSFKGLVQALVGESASREPAREWGSRWSTRSEAAEEASRRGTVCSAPRWWVLTGMRFIRGSRQLTHCYCLLLTLYLYLYLNLIIGAN